MTESEIIFALLLSYFEFYQTSHILGTRVLKIEFNLIFSAQIDDIEHDPPPSYQAAIASKSRDDSHVIITGRRSIRPTAQSSPNHFVRNYNRTPRLRSGRNLPKPEPAPLSGKVTFLAVILLILFSRERW